MNSHAVRTVSIDVSVCLPLEESKVFSNAPRVENRCVVDSAECISSPQGHTEPRRFLRRLISLSQAAMALELGSHPKPAQIAEALESVIVKDGSVVPLVLLHSPDQIMVLPTAPSH